MDLSISKGKMTLVRHPKAKAFETFVEACVSLSSLCPNMLRQKRTFVQDATQRSTILEMDKTYLQREVSVQL